MDALEVHKQLLERELTVRQAEEGGGGVPI